MILKEIKEKKNLLVFFDADRMNVLYSEMLKFFFNSPFLGLHLFLVFSHSSFFTKFKVLIFVIEMSWDYKKFYISRISEIKKNKHVLFNLSHYHEIRLIDFNGM